MRKYSKRQWVEVKDLHKLIIHRPETIKNDKEWYRLARKETLGIERLDIRGQLGGICRACGFK